MGKKSGPKPKQVNIELIEDFSSAPYKLMAEVRKKFHPDTEKARIALAWRKGTKADVDGHVVLGRCVKASELQRELAVWDFVILLNHEVWNDKDFTVDKQSALLDHELCHCEQVLDAEGDQKKDSNDRLLWRTRRHDIEEFHSIVQRHGVWKKDLERFAQALLKQRENPTLFPQTAAASQVLQ